MARVLVLLPTDSYRTSDFVKAATAMDVDLVIASEEDPPFDLGDRFVRIDCSQPTEAAAVIVDLADRTPIDAVIAADDAGVVVAALVSERLGLANHPPAAAAAARDKLEMRRRWATSEVPQPAFQALDGPGSLGIDYPVVIKPRTGTASRGVLRVDGPAQMDEAVIRVGAIAAAMGETGPLLAEAFVAGDEVAVEGMVVAGKLVVLAVFDKPEAPQGPTFPETLLVTPPALTPATHAELERVVAAGVTALGLTDGPVHAEARIDPDDRIYLLEIAARSIGGLCGRSLRFGLTGSSLEEVILSGALGRPLPKRQPRATGVLMLPVEHSGTLIGVTGVEEALAIEGITEIDITVPPGTRVETLPEGDRYLGFVFGVGATRHEVIERIRAATDRLEVVVD